MTEQDKAVAKEISTFKRRLKRDISNEQFKADLLSGTASIENIRVKGKLKKASTGVVINKNLSEFMKFMEGNYKNSNIKVELKKRI